MEREFELDPKEIGAWLEANAFFTSEGTKASEGHITEHGSEMGYIFENQDAYGIEVRIILNKGPGSMTKLKNIIQEMRMKKGSTQNLGDGTIFEVINLNQGKPDDQIPEAWTERFKFTHISPNGPTAPTAPNG